MRLFFTMFITVFLFTSAGAQQPSLPVSPTSVVNNKPPRELPAPLRLLYERLEKDYKTDPITAVKNLSAFRDLGLDCEVGLIGLMRPWLNTRGITNSTIKNTLDARHLSAPKKPGTSLNLSFIPSAYASLSSSERAAFTLRDTTAHFELYTETSTSPDATYVEQIGDVLETAYSAYVDAYGFSAPNGGGISEVYIHDGVSGGLATYSGFIEVEDDMTDDSRHKIYYVPAHELFHLIQYESFNTSAEVFTEGGARWAEDVVNTAYDGYNTYTKNSDYWLSNMQGMTTAYGFALFWRYLSENFSAMTDTADASYGTDVMKELYSYLGGVGTSASMSDMDGALASLTGGHVSTMVGYYQDFLIAMFAKDLANPLALPYSPRSGNPRWDFLEDEEASYEDLAYYRDGDALTSGSALSYTNTGEYYYATWIDLGWEGFVNYGNAEYNRITLDSSLTSVTVTPSKIDNENIHYAAAVQYSSSRADGTPVVRKITGISDTSSKTFNLYNRIFSSGRLQAQYLIVIPFTLDPGPYDGDGNNFSYSVSGT